MRGSDWAAVGRGLEARARISFATQAKNLSLAIGVMACISVFLALFAGTFALCMPGSVPWTTLALRREWSSPFSEEIGAWGWALFAASSAAAWTWHIASCRKAWSDKPGGWANPGAPWPEKAFCFLFCPVIAMMPGMSPPPEAKPEPPQLDTQKIRSSWREARGAALAWGAYNLSEGVRAGWHLGIFFSTMIRTISLMFMTPAAALLVFLFARAARLATWKAASALLAGPQPGVAPSALASPATTSLFARLAEEGRATEGHAKAERDGLAADAASTDLSGPGPRL